MDHELLWSTMDSMGAPRHIISLLKNLYANQEAQVRLDQDESRWFPIGKGARQGCILSPGLFNVYAEMIMRNAEDKEVGIRIGGQKVNNLRYADDTTIMAETREDLIHLLEVLEEESSKAGLRLNASKTKIMTTDQQLNGTLKVGNNEIEIVDRFNFLGSFITNDGDCRLEIARRTGIARNAMKKLTRIWKDKDIQLKTKTQLVRALVFSSMLYGAESWTLTLDSRRKIQAAEMWCWRRLLRIPWTSNTSNEEVIRRIGEAADTPLDGTVYDRKLRYFGHTVRRSDSLEKEMMLAMAEGSRARGRPRSRWLDDLKKAACMTLPELLDAARDRDRWRTISSMIAKSRPRLGGTR